MTILIKFNMNKMKTGSGTFESWLRNDRLASGDPADTF